MRDDQAIGLRERRRARTRRSIQEHAMRLFLERGYDATTVGDVAAAAEVSHMTVFRHFPTKEALVLADDYDPLLVERIVARPAGEPLLRRLEAGLLQALAEVLAADRELVLARTRFILATPALRARQWETQYATQQAVVAALCGHTADPEQEFRVWVATGVCLAAAAAAIIRWAEQDGRPDLLELTRHALAVVAEEATAR
jgi:AcrR family transcriptional regulator